MNMHSYVFGFFLLVLLPAASFAAQADEAPGSSEQRAACDARCREDYQNNASALQACLRDCGAIGPASPGGAIAPSHEATHTAQQASPAVPPAEPTAAIKLNSSESNVYRSTSSPDTGAQDEQTGATEDSDGDR